MSVLNNARWRKLRLRVLQRDNWRCRSCGRYGNECDHVIPHHKGGDPWDPTNLQCLCRRCQISKTRAEYAGPRRPRDSRWAALLDELTDVGRDGQ